MREILLPSSANAFLHVIVQQKRGRQCECAASIIDHIDNRLA